MTNKLITIGVLIVAAAAITYYLYSKELNYTAPQPYTNQQSQSDSAQDVR